MCIRRSVFQITIHINQVIHTNTSCFTKQLVYLIMMNVMSSKGSSLIAVRVNRVLYLFDVSINNNYSIAKQI